MMSRVREAVFSMLTTARVLRESASHLDLFSGSGVVGLEALSTRHRQGYLRRLLVNVRQDDSAER